MIDSPIPYDSLKDRAVTIELGSEKIPVISINHLIELKVKSGRKQDISDVEHLRAILEK